VQFIGVFMSEINKIKAKVPKALLPAEKFRLKELVQKAKASADKIPKGTFKEV
jgi:hypothetical protein